MKTITVSIDYACAAFSETMHIRRRTIRSFSTIYHFGYYAKDRHDAPFMDITFRLVLSSTTSVGVRHHWFTEQVH